ncbi:hypothetical protein PMI01_02219 [Caulobacter sp. AP07]|uniref:hypothetical protein n=1 Tax=Caulobacter sp. AP07 TaxID=1144304 RepID=UPI0002722039|nr:hypothetical protein [Caulobacter sp. AP07]EJL33256.1 hypothetical protein PMI01_02219 [Caulobacter sp. AP07]
MSVFLAGRPVPHPGSLSELGRLSLAFVDGGAEWLGWAIGDPASRYDFADETALVGGVQEGLHATGFALLPNLGLRVSPIKLMTLGLSDLRLLANAQQDPGAPGLAARVRKVLDAHGLLDSADLDQGAALLKDLGVDGAPVFQCLDFEARAALHGLVGSLDPKTIPAPLAKEAAAFAVLQAQSPPEFVDYYRTYLRLADKLDLVGATASDRAAAAAAAVNALLPLLFGAHDCPRVDGLVGPGEVGRIVQDWVRQGRTLGFPRLSVAVWQVVEHSAFRREIGDSARRIIEDYLRAAQDFLASVPIVRGRMDQDGASCTFPLEQGQYRAQVRLDAPGLITLGEFGPSKGAQA